jgi:integrase
MARIRLRYVQSFTDRRTGLTFHYFRRPGCKRERLPGLPGSVEFMEAYQVALAAPRPQIGAKRTKGGTVNAAIVGYYESLAFRALAPGTQVMRRAILERFRTQHGDLPVAKMPPTFITLTLNKLKPHAARNWFKTFRHFMQFAVSVGLCKSDPTQGLRSPKVKANEHRAWTDHEVTAYESTHPIGTKARLAFALGYYTAQRRSDVVRMGKQHISNGFLHICQDKTDAALDIPVHPKLREIIDASPSGHLTFLITKGRRPYSPNDFSEQFRQWCDVASLPTDCHFHGLRYSAAKVLAEAGCSAHEIAAITGHMTLAMVQKYTKAAEQRRMASSAMARRTEHEQITVKRNPV